MQNTARIFFAIHVFAFTVSGQVCPAKIFGRLCKAYSEAVDTSTLKARIKLDFDLWVPSKNGENNPMVQSAKEMIEKYDFRRIEAPDSAYNPSFMNGGSPGIPEVIYQNVLLAKSALDSVRLESYVEEIDEGCRNTISVRLCDTLNMSTAFRVKFMFSWRYGMIIDSATKIAFLSQFDLRNPEDSSEKVSFEAVAANPNRGVALVREEFERIIDDPKVHQFDLWIKPTVNLPYSKPLKKWQSKTKGGYLLNGKSVDGIDAAKFSNEPSRKIWYRD